MPSCSFFLSLSLSPPSFRLFLSLSSFLFCLSFFRSLFSCLLFLTSKKPNNNHFLCHSSMTLTAFQHLLLSSSVSPYWVGYRYSNTNPGWLTGTPKVETTRFQTASTRSVATSDSLIVPSSVLGSFQLLSLFFIFLSDRFVFMFCDFCSCVYPMLFIYLFIFFFWSLCFCLFRLCSWCMLRYVAGKIGIQGIQYILEHNYYAHPANLCCLFSTQRPVPVRFSVGGR